jgi:hypothetical protein
MDLYTEKAEIKQVQYKIECLLFGDPATKKRVSFIDGRQIYKGVVGFDRLLLMMVHLSSAVVMHSPLEITKNL